MKYTGTLPMHSPTTIQHFGVKGQKWGRRRYQNEDGSLTAEGREHYANMTDKQRHRAGMRQVKLAARDAEKAQYLGAVKHPSKLLLENTRKERLAKASDKRLKTAKEIGISKKEMQAELTNRSRIGKDVRENKLVRRSTWKVGAAAIPVALAVGVVTGGAGAAAVSSASIISQAAAAVTTGSVGFGAGMIGGNIRTGRKRRREVASARQRYRNSMSNYLRSRDLVDSDGLYIE